MSQASDPPGPGRGAPGSAEENRAILRARAGLLARRTQAEPDAGEALDVIEFSLASETYGIESMFVHGVHHLKHFTPLPGTPPFVLGIVNVRGQIVSVVNLKKFFNLPERGLGELNKVIIIRKGAMEFGILADAVLGVRSIPLVLIHPAPPTVTGVGAEYLRGVTVEGVIILDARRILGDDKVVVHQEVE